MLLHYHYTPLEQWIEDMYRKFEITSPEQLHIGMLAEKLNIWVYFTDMGCMAIEDKGLYSININRRLSHEEQWEDFLHEVCHVLRHAGNQMIMPGAYLDWQELDAANFQLYAAMPFSMIARMTLPERICEAIEILSQEFHVTAKLAAARIEQMNRRRVQALLDSEFRARADRNRKTYDPANWSAETKSIMGKLYRQLEKKGDIRHGQALRHL